MNPLQDSSRLHYEPAELKVFENIECEWPLFLLLLLLGALIEGDSHKAEEYRTKLDGLILKSEETGLQTVPELYYVPADKVVAMAPHATHPTWCPVL